MRLKYFGMFLLLVVVTIIGCSEKSQPAGPTEDTIVIQGSFPSDLVSNESTKLNIRVSLNREETREITGKYTLFTRKIKNLPKPIQTDTFFKEYLSMNKEVVETIELEKLINDTLYQIDISAETPSIDGNKKANIKTIFFSVRNNRIIIENDIEISVGNQATR
ncbi:hypothetical protein [Paenibacillus algicola]|nr:hypothetical protein [Paenibacillus algicola]